MLRKGAMQTVKLANGVQMPVLGFGVYEARGEDCVKAVQKAVEAGYRHFDTALAYRNEHLVAQGLQQAGLKRHDVFITTKLPPGCRGYAQTQKAIQESLRNLSFPEQPSFIDLYLIHAPYGTREERLGQWHAMCESVDRGDIRAAGVSNYGIHHLQELLDSAEVEKHRPVCNQMELHPFLQRRELVDFCRQRDIAMAAWAPVTRGMCLTHPTVLDIAQRHQVSAAQILIRWSIQKGFMPLPKSITPSRILDNINVFHFKLSDKDMEELDGLEEGLTTSWDPSSNPL
ncbi:oxidoreductase [Protomyces lactucae-debilis]|uniref:Oxidoreductase n=1 Tax=Protomyces lactucae-debilis TaxID=2754530 RepID=A0A1Y2FX56_PROLT|nr:oxidoreductase [Protomyces lactucae-debilis]ORY87884.1 oxidoreductase [Protomyces lactucae-debilis]